MDESPLMTSNGFRFPRILGSGDGLTSATAVFTRSHCYAPESIPLISGMLLLRAVTLCP